MNTKNEFNVYDYKEVKVDEKMMSFYLDCYENFGWILDENYPVVKGKTQMILHLKRNRKIVNKTELTRLQRHFEACVDELHMLEKSKTTTAITVTITLGMIGTAFMAGSVFSIVGDQPIIWLCILLSIPGFALWIIPPVIYKKIIETKAKKIEPFIEKKYDEIYEICQKGHALL